MPRSRSKCRRGSTNCGRWRRRGWMGRWLVPATRFRFSRQGLPYVDTTVDAARLEARATGSRRAREFLGREAYDHAQDAAGEHDFEIVFPLHGGDAVA